MAALFGALALARGHASWLDGVYSWEAPELRPANYDPVSRSRGRRQLRQQLVFTRFALPYRVWRPRRCDSAAHSDSDAQIPQGGRPGWSVSMSSAAVGGRGVKMRLQAGTGGYGLQIQQL